MRLLYLGLYMLAVAAAVHAAALYVAPTAIMAIVLRNLPEPGANGIAHQGRITEKSRQIVAPSPDLLYSLCKFDLDRGAMRIITGAPKGTYWSVAFYGANTDNFKTINDAQAAGNPLSILLIGPDAPGVNAPLGETVVRSPTKTGLVLFRTLVADPAAFEAIDAERRKARCVPAKS